MSREEIIAKALQDLESYPPEDEERPATVAFFPPDAKSFMKGNQDGFARLAIAALLAAQGTQQKFDKGNPWFKSTDLDWSVSGLDFDESAHELFPKPDKKRQRQENVVTFVFALILVFVGACAVTGFMRITQALFHH